MRKAWIILMMSVMGHYDDKCNGILWSQRFGALLLQRSWSILIFIVMTILWIIMMMCMVHCDDRFHGPLRWKWAWSIVITGLLEHCEEKGNGALWLQGHGKTWWQGSWNIVMTGVMEHCDGKGMEHCDEKTMVHTDYMCHVALWWQGQGAMWWERS